MKLNYIFQTGSQCLKFCIYTLTHFFTGHTLEYIVLCALSVLDVNPYWFLAPTVISSLLGGFPALMTATVCYASDLSDRKSRTWHLVWFDSAFNCGILAGTLLAPIVFNTYGYSIVFSISAGCLFTSWLYTQFCVPETITNQERVRKKSQKCVHLL